MMKQTMVLGIFLSCSANLLGDYVLDRKAAMELVGAKKYEEALAAFKKMVGGDVTDFQKSDALEQAALCADRLKRYDEAMKLAQSIPLEPVSKAVQMKVMSSNRKRRELIDKFKDEDIDSWPDSVAGDAFYIRGRTYYSLKNGEAAEADLKEAVKYVVDDNARGVMLNTLGDTYQHLLKNDALAIEAYRKVYTTRNTSKHCHAAMGIAAILARQEKYDEAIRELERIDLAKIPEGYWRVKMLAAFGDVLAKAGKKAEAIAKYKEALEVKGLLPSQEKACQKAIQELETGAR